MAEAEKQLAIDNHIRKLNEKAREAEEDVKNGATYKEWADWDAEDLLTKDWLEEHGIKVDKTGKYLNCCHRHHPQTEIRRKRRRIV